MREVMEWIVQDIRLRAVYGCEYGRVLRGGLRMAQGWDPPAPATPGIESSQPVGARPALEVGGT